MSKEAERRSALLANVDRYVAEFEEISRLRKVAVICQRSVPARVIQALDGVTHTPVSASYQPTILNGESLYFVHTDLSLDEADQRYDWMTPDDPATRIFERVSTGPFQEAEKLRNGTFGKESALVAYGFSFDEQRDRRTLPYCTGSLAVVTQAGLEVEFVRKLESVARAVTAATLEELAILGTYAHPNVSVTDITKVLSLQYQLVAGEIAPGKTQEIVRPIRYPSPQRNTQKIDFDASQMDRIRAAVAKRLNGTAEGANGSEVNSEGLFINGLIHDEDDQKVCLYVVGSVFEVIEKITLQYDHLSNRRFRRGQHGIVLVLSDDEILDDIVKSRIATGNIKLLRLSELDPDLHAEVHKGG